MTIPEIDPEKDRKYDKQTTGAFSLYVLIQYFIILAGTALFLFNADKFNIWEQALAVSLIILGVTGAGVILEEKKYSFGLEVFRVLTTPLVIIFLLIPNTGSIIITSILAYGVISFASLIFIKKSYSTKEQPTTKTIS
jgi:glucose-6-phosphate-specific signal transduction histidine kinase